MSLNLLNLVRKTVYNTTLVSSKLVSIHSDGFVLCYHSISNDNWEFSISEIMFQRQIEYLLTKYTPYSLEDLQKYFEGSITPSKPFFIITFDDGYKNVLKVKDFVKDKGIKPVSFVLAGPDKVNKYETGNNLPFLDIEEIKSLKSEGWDIGCHSKSHTDFWHMSDSQVIQEITQSKISLESNLGFNIEYFAYPKGRYTSEVIKAVQNAGYKMAFSMDNTIITRNNDQLTIPRIGVMQTHTFGEFKALPLALSTKIRGAIFKETGLLNDY